MLYSNQNYYFLRKPHGIASTFGEQKSILDFFSDSKELQKNIQKDSDFEQYVDYCYLSDCFLEQDLSIFVDNQTKQFSKEQEFGLLNRLDNDTGGFLYFAKTQEIFGLYKEQQRKGAIQKMYMAEVHGNPFFRSDLNIMTIITPIMHHAFDDQKMITIIMVDDKKKGRGKLHQVSTTIELISYDSIKNISLLRVMIHKGVRHQIRVHCKSIGAPIVGDVIYGPKPAISETLHLRSIGMK